MVASVVVVTEGIKMDVEILINKKKEEIIEEVKQETEGLPAIIADKAEEKLEEFAAELKTAIDMHPIGAADLLRVIEKGGVVYQTAKNVGDSISIKDMLYNLSLDGRYGYLKGNIRLTLIIEPI